MASADDRLQQNGSQPPNLDPYLVHKFEKAGRYIAAIRDSAERGSPNYVYRLAIYPVEPDFDLKGLTPQITFERLTPLSNAPLPAARIVSLDDLISTRNDCHRVEVHTVIRSMWQTSLDMNTKYMETSEGSLALQIPANLGEC